MTGLLRKIILCLSIAATVASIPVTHTHAADREAPFSLFKKKEKVYASGDTVFPSFPGGNYMNFIYNNIKIPEDIPHDLLIEGSVEFGIIISETGKVDSVCIVKSLYPPFDKEVLRVAAMLPDFKPATISGTPIRFGIVSSVHFRYDKYSKAAREGPRKLRGAEVYLNGNLVKNFNLNAITDENVDSMVPGTKDTPPKIYITLKTEEEN